MAPIRHLVGGKDNRRVESSHLDDMGNRERLLLIKVGLSKNGEEKEGLSIAASSALNNPSPLRQCSSFLLQRMFKASLAPWPSSA